MEKVYFNLIREDGERRLPSGPAFKNLLLTAVLLAVNAFLAAAIFYSPAAEPVAKTPSGAVSPRAYAVPDTAAFDSAGLADVKAAFKNMDTSYLKRLSHDVYELQMLAAVSPSRVLKLVEDAYNPSIVIKSLMLRTSGTSGVSATLSGRALSGANFITFSDHISRAKGVRGFSFESKKALIGASERDISDGVDFTMTFEMRYD